MPFMLIILVALVGITIWAFFHTNPQGVNARTLLAYNVVVLVLTVPAAIAVGTWLYADAVAAKAAEKGMATYLVIMASGTAALMVVALGGFIRNIVVFPHSKRKPQPPVPDAHR